MLTRKKVAMILAEFLGTALLTLAVLAVSKSTIGIPYFVAIAAGLVVATVTLTLGAVSGAHLNPLVTIGLWSVRRVKTLPAIVYLAAQLLGGIVAYWLFSYFVGQTWGNTNNEFEGRVLVAEAVGAFIFSLGWAATVFQKMEGGRAAATVGMSLMLGVLVSAAGTGGIVNPAVALGLRSVEWSFMLGPILGGIIGFNLYKLLFAPTDSLIEKPVKAETVRKK